MTCIIERARQRKIEQIREAKAIMGVQLEAWPKWSDICVVDDPWDANGDSVTAIGRYLFDDHFDGLVQGIFAQGTDRHYAARVFRKMAEMLEGPDGLALVSIGPEPGNNNIAGRQEDGGLNLINCQKGF